MIYSLDIKIVSDNQTLLDAIKNKVPIKLDSQIWADEYKVKQTQHPDTGNTLLIIAVRFIDTSKRQVIMDWIKTKAQNVQDDILAGSYVGYHQCDHDEDRLGCPKPTIIWSK